MKFSAFDRAAARLPKPLLRVASLLLIWIGLSFTVVSAVGVVVALRVVMAGSTKLPKNFGTPSHFLLTQAGWLFFGAVLLVLAQQTNRISRWSGEEKEAGTRSDKWRAILHPSPEDRLHEWTVDFDESPEALKAKLESLPKLPHFVPLVLLTLDGNQPAARLRGQDLKMVGRASAVNNSTWTGLLSADQNGKATLQGHLKVSQMGEFNSVQNVFKILWSVGFLLGGLAMVLSGKWIGFFSLPIVLGFWLLMMSISRAAQWNARNHERLLEDLFRGRLGATAIYLTPRVRTLFKK